MPWYPIISAVGATWKILKPRAVSRLENTRSLATDRHIYAAGGVRNEKDLARLENIGVAGVLLASALHDGSINKSVLERYPSP